LGQFSKNYTTFYHKNCQKALQNMVLGSEIRDPVRKKPIPDPGSRGQKGTGSATLLFTKVIYTFLKSVWKDGFFDTPFDLIKEKKISSHSRVSVYFLWTKKPKNGSNHSIFRKTVFYKQVFEFHRPSKFLCQTSGRQIHWSLVPGERFIQTNTNYF
jgi:hypothetical protein